jgi:hypothetical protein
MLFQSLLGVIFSVSIAPIPTKGRISPVPLSALDDLVNRTDFLVGLAAKPRDSQLILRFFDAQPLFPDVRFELFAPIDLKRVIPNPPRSPYLALFESHRLVGLIGQIDSEVTLAHLLDLHITKTRPVVDSLEGMLFGAPITILARETQFEAAYNLSVAGGAANVVSVSEKIASELFPGDDNCGLFRDDDLAFAAFPCNLSGFRANKAPLFSYYNEKKILGSRELVFAFHSKEPEENATAFLEELGAEYRDFRFVYAPRGETFVITDFLTYVFHHPFTNLAVINYSGKFYYDLSSIVTREQFDEEPFNPVVWKQRIAEIVAAVRSGRLPKVFKSNMEGDREAGNVHFAVGTNYLQYVLNQTTDTFVFYHKTHCPTCQNVFVEMFRRFAGAVERYPDLPYEFVHIDISSNRIPEGFPVRLAGSIVLYPANATVPKVLPFESYDVLLWFAQKYSSVPHALSFELPTGERLAKIEKRVAELRLYLSDDVKEGFEKVVSDLRADIQAKYPEQEWPNAEGRPVVIEPFIKESAQEL